MVKEEGVHSIEARVEVEGEEVEVVVTVEVAQYSRNLASRFFCSSSSRSPDATAEFLFSESSSGCTPVLLIATFSSSQISSIILFFLPAQAVVLRVEVEVVEDTKKNLPLLSFARPDLDLTLSPAASAEMTTAARAAPRTSRRQCQ